MSLVTFEQILAASHRIKGHIKSTPMVSSARLQKLLGVEVYFKMENMQHTGAYKERGALNKLKTLTPAEQKAGVFAASAGNHAQGVAYHSGRMGIQSTIFMPMGTPVIKVTRTQDYGAKVVLTGNNFDEAFDACQEEVTRTGGTLIHPFDDPLVIAGQGTIGLEMLSEQPDLDVIVVPVGGGGLISGISIAAKEINPKIKIIGVESVKIPAMRLAMEGDYRVHPPVTTIADGINVRRVGKVTSCLCAGMVDGWVGVSEEEICRAVLFLLEGEKTVTEGAGATGVAALMSGKVIQIPSSSSSPPSTSSSSSPSSSTNTPFLYSPSLSLPLPPLPPSLSRPLKIGVVFSGGNIDVNVISQVIESGLVDSGRRFRISMDLPDRPGSLSALMTQISAMQANVVSVHHERTRMASFGAARVLMTLDVRDRAHAEEVMRMLTETHKDQNIHKVEY